MKDSKEKEHRISNLKDMIHNIKDDNEDKLDYEDVEEDSELIDYLNQDSINYDELEINDEFIYHPSDDDSENAINLEENPIDEDFIIKTPAEKEIEEINENLEVDDFPEDIITDVSENFDNIVNAKIGKTPIMAILSTVLGVIFILISAFIFESRSDRVIDNVVSGESNFIFVIVLVLGLLLLCYGIFKIFNIKNPFESYTSSIDSIDKEKDTTEDDKKEPETMVIPKSNIPLDKNAYKIGEFEMEDLKNKLKKPTTSKIKKQPAKRKLDEIPPAKEKKESEKGLTSDEIEEKEYEQVKRDTETIDDIFAEVEDIDDIPIISIDSEEKQK